MTNQADKPSVEGLKPCPFCGAEMMANTNQQDLYVRRYGTHYEHPRNGCYLSVDEVSPSGIEAWNSRASEAAPAAQPATPLSIAELRELLDVVQHALNDARNYALRGEKT